MYIEYNPNPEGSLVGDSVVRAISKLFDWSWEDAFLKLVTEAYFIKDMPSSDRVCGEFLRKRCYHKIVVPDTCHQCYTVREFCDDHPEGKYLVATGNTVIAVINGNYYDSFDSGNEIAIYYWRRNAVQ